MAIRYRNIAILSLVFVAFLWTGQPTVHLNMRRTRYTSCTCPRKRCTGEKQDEPDVKMAYVRRWTHSTEKNLSRAARDWWIIKTEGKEMMNDIFGIRYLSILCFQRSFGSRKVRLKRICIYNCKCKFRWSLDRHIRCVRDYARDLESVNIFVVKSTLEVRTERR